MFIISFLVIVLILLSVNLVITVPVTLSSPEDWEENKGEFIQRFRIWFCFIALTAATDGILNR